MDRETVLRFAKEAGMCGMATTVVCEISELERFASAVAAAVKEEDARIMRGLIEGTHECTAEEASREAGLDEEDELRRLRHWSDVHLKNATLRSAADFIRASIKGVK